MIDWYYLFVLVIALVAIGSTPFDRAASRIVLAATLASWALVDLVTVHLYGAWKLCVPGMIETLTILSLLRWAQKPSRYYQSACLVVAWLAHVLCFVDLGLGTDIVYTRYEAILACVAVAQIAFFHDTYLHQIRRMGRWWSQRGGDCAVVVCSPSLSSPVLHRPSNSVSYTISPCTTTCTKTWTF
jgi:hypothetical protein